MASNLDVGLVVVISLIVAGMVTVLAFGLVLVLVIRDTIRRRGKWCMNLPLRRPACSKCGEPAPMVRIPASFRQGLWGGWTCKQCGFEQNLLGPPVEDQPFPAKWSAKLDQAERNANEASPRRGEERYRRESDPSYRGGSHDG